jgi:hypothetical protein
MKKLALISGLLFLVVYLGVNTMTKDDSSFDVTYPPMNVSTLTTSEIPETTAEADQTSQKKASGQGQQTYIIIASFTDLEQAQKMAKAYRVQYQADIIVLPPTSGNNFRLSYGSYSTSGEAQAALGTVKQAGFKDAWLLGSK